MIDTDGDGVFDDQDVCPGFDDTLDSDSDGLPDGCDICPNDPDNNCQEMNIAPLATTVRASSENTATQQYAVKAADECIEGYSKGDYKCEWATTGQKAGAWIRLNWNDLYRVSKVVIYDRPNSSDQVTAATLSFDDGSTVTVGNLDNGGGPVEVTFAPKVISSLTLTVNAVSSTTKNIGLCEIEVFGVPE
jgi:hypothetical protein